MGKRQYLPMKHFYDHPDDTKITNLSVENLEITLGNKTIREAVMDKIAGMDKEKKYKVTHFRHTPNNLVDQNKFELVGHIIGSAFGGEEIPTFNAEEAVDITDAMKGDMCK